MPIVRLDEVHADPCATSMRVGPGRSVLTVGGVLTILALASCTAAEEPVADDPVTDELSTPAPRASVDLSSTSPPTTGAPTGSESEVAAFSLLDELRIDRNQTNRYATVIGSDAAEAAIECTNETNEVGVERYCWVFWTQADYETAQVRPNGEIETACWVAQAGSGVSDAETSEAELNETPDVRCDGYLSRVPPPTSDLEICDHYNRFAFNSRPGPPLETYLQELEGFADDFTLSDALRREAEALSDSDATQDDYPVLDRCIELGG
jgi:hypothetical protein